jgi:FtsP/CotA-like multicopper oxidase with cupredoxin domain
MELSRRDLLKLGVLGGAAALFPFGRTASTASLNRLAQSKMPKPFVAGFVVPPVLKPARKDATTDYYNIAMRPGTASIAPGLPTPIWGYNGIAPGPTIKATQGRKVVMRQINRLPLKHPQLGYTPLTSVHLHGSASLPQHDGYANDGTLPKQWKDYRYPNFQDARTLWYHDHGIMHTGPNVYMGLAAQYHLHDATEAALPIPKGAYDVPLIVNDVMLTSTGKLLWNDDDRSGLFGDIIMVNGRPWPAMKVERRKYRFRMLNASISRSYNWRLDSGEPLVVIGTDGGLMPTPQPVTNFRHGNGERYDVIIDFEKYPVGRRVLLQNLSNKNNIDYDGTGKVMAFDVVANASSTLDNTIPDVLNPHSEVMALEESMAVATRRFDLKRRHGEWTINGVTWKEVAESGFQFSLANPALNSVEVWEFVNESGGWFHPFHVHLIDFKILDRNGLPPMAHELGPKDVVYVGEEEIVRVVARFGPHSGRYMMHCHNLVHEDHDMMGQFEVGAGGDDPVSADPPRPLPATWPIGG